MRALLAFAAVIAAVVPSGPAFADPGGGASLTIRSGDFVGGDRHHRRSRGNGDLLYVDREYQGDTAWRSESFNDWWHNDPNRSFPRWMQNNANCERKWWGADQLRC